MTPGELINKAAEEAAKKNNPADNGQQEGQPTLNDETVFGYFDANNGALLKYLSKLEGKELTSLSDLKTVEEKIVEKVIEKEPTLPEDVKTFLDYKLKTNRGIDDFIKAQMDWTKIPEDTVVMEYIQQTMGLEGQELDDYMKAKYNLSEDEVSQRELSLAKAEKKATYRKALEYLNEQKKTFELPTAQKQGELIATEQEAANRRSFAEGMISAVDQINEIEVGDFKFKVEGKESLKEDFQSVENIVRKFSKNGVLDHKSLVSTLIKGLNAEAIANAKAEAEIAKFVENEKKKMTNPVKPADNVEVVDRRKAAQSAAKHIFGSF